MTPQHLPHVARSVEDLTTRCGYGVSRGVKALGENEGVPVLHEGFKGGCDIRPSEDIFLIFACFDTVTIAD